MIQLEKITQAMRSKNTLCVSLLSFASGLPLGLIWIAIPDWLRTQGFDLKSIGLFSLVQLPWSLKPLWAPLMDRFRIPFLGQRQGWILITQIALSALILLLSGLDINQETLTVYMALVFSMAMLSASFDIALDALAVEILNKEEQGVAVGLRTALYRLGMFASGALTISLTANYSWTLVNVVLALLFLPMLGITSMLKSEKLGDKSITLKEAVFEPIKELFSRKDVYWILLVVVFYKFSDNLGQALLRPFLVDRGFGAFERGVALGTIGLAATLLGTFLGGILTNVLGVKKSLMYFGVLQIFSNIGYVVLCKTEPLALVLYLAMGFETLTQGLGTGAFSVLLMRMTNKKFSISQYAILSSLFTLPRVVSGPLAGLLSQRYGWETFFYVTMLLGLPGLWLVHRASQKDMEG